MRKGITLCLSVIIILSLLGCDKQQDIRFYYPRNEIQYGVADGVISGETREISPEENNLEYLLKLYLEGPVSLDLYAPFPAGTSLISFISDKSSLVLTLSDSFSELQNLEYTIACASIAATCFDLTDVQTVTIHAAETSITIDRQGLMFWDQSWQNPQN